MFINIQEIKSLFVANCGSHVRLTPNWQRPFSSPGLGICVKCTSQPDSFFKLSIASRVVGSDAASILKAISVSSRSRLIADLPNMFFFKLVTEASISGLNNSISCGIHYPIALHMQKAYEYLGHKPEDFPLSKKYAEEILSLPMFPELTEEDVAEVVEKLQKAQ